MIRSTGWSARRLLAATVVLSLLACTGAGTDKEDDTTSADADGDGVPTDEDCDDADPTAGPASYWYVDADGDGYGNGATGALACVAPGGSTADGTDCDDASASVFPGATEVCNAVDDDCDDAVDDDAVDAESWYEDTDGDGFGGEAAVGCDRPATAVDDGGDCDDAAATVNPDADERCNTLDDDCDGDVDEDAADAEVWYTDADADGYGDEESAFTSCSEPVGAVTTAGDCDDASAAIHVGGVEACDGTDGDCDGEIDNGACPCDTWTQDGHGYMFCGGHLTWQDAQDACSDYSYDLASIGDAAEGSWMYEIASGTFPSERDFWIGLTDTAVEGTWVWADGSSAGYTGWGATEPSNSGAGEDCVAIGYFWNADWNDSGCTDTKPYICESN